MKNTTYMDWMSIYLRVTTDAHMMCSLNIFVRAHLFFLHFYMAFYIHYRIVRSVEIQEL